MSSLFEALIIAIIIFLTIFMIWSYSRANQVFDDWVRNNNFKVRKQSLKLLFRGRFTLTTSGGQIVYLVELEDGKKCWVIMGGYFAGMLSKRLQVFWEE